MTENTINEYINVNGQKIMNKYFNKFSKEELFTMVLANLAVLIDRKSNKSPCIDELDDFFRGALKRAKEHRVIKTKRSSK